MNYRKAWLLILAGVMSLSLGLATGYVGTYNGLNKGVYVGPCGVEVYGSPGAFCGMG